MGKLMLLIPVAVLFCASIIFHFLIKGEKKKKLAIIITTLLCLGIMTGLRSTNVGTDTPAYSMLYEKASLLEWSQFKLDHLEPGYVLLTKLFAKNHVQFQAFLCVTALIIYLPMGFYLYRNSNNVTLALLFYICFDVFILNLSSLRGAIVLALFLLAMECLKIKKIYIAVPLYIIIIALATSIHVTAAICLVYPLIHYFVKAKKTFYILAIAGFFIITLYGAQIFTVFSEFEEYAGNVNGVTVTGKVLLLSFLCIFGAVFLDDNILRRKILLVFDKIDLKLKFSSENKLSISEDKVLLKRKSRDFSMIVVGVLAVYIYYLMNKSVFTRINQYFVFAFVIFVPNVIGRIPSKSLRILSSTGLALFLLAYYWVIEMPILGPYSFFFQ